MAKINKKYSPCASKIVEASNDKLTMDEAEDILKDVNDAKEKLNKRGFDESSAVSKAVNEYFERIKRNKDLQKLRTLKAAKQYTETKLRAQSRIDQGLKVHEAILAELVGIQSPIEGTRNSIDLHIETTTANYAALFISKLDQENLLPILASGEYTRDIAKDLWELSYGRKPISKTPEIQKIAQIIYDVQGDMKKRMNKAGADIGDLQGFIVSQSHDRDLMMKAGFEEWRNFVLPKLDIQRSFEGTVNADDIDQALKGAYEALVTGIRKTPARIEPSDKLYQFTGPSNLGKKKSQARQIIFKNSDDFIAYNEKFGSMSFNDTLEMSIRGSSRDIALLERMTTNPEAFANKLVKDLKEGNRTKIAEGQKFKEELVQGAINQVTGLANFSVNKKISDINDGFNAYNNMRFLGRALASQIADIPFKALEYQYQGRNIFSSYMQTFDDLKSNIADIDEQKRFSSLTGVYAEQWIGDLNSKITGGRNLLQKLNRTQRLFFKLNGMRLWDSTNKTAMAKTMAHDLGLQRHKSFSELDDITQRIFGNYDINDQDWDIIRESGQDIDGRHFIVSESIKDQAIKHKLSSYFIDRVNHAIPQVTGSTKARMRGSTRRGTAAGEFLEMALHFKSFMFAQVEKVWGRELYARGKADYASMAQLLLMTSVFGYIAMTLKDLAKGKTAKDPMKWDTIAAAVVQGGGLSIAGDLFFQDMGYGKDVTDIAIGPTAATVNDLYKVGQAVLKGDDAKARAFNAAVGLVPFNNLFYVREPLNQVLLYSIQEKLNPEFLNRQEKRMRESYGQEFAFR